MSPSRLSFAVALVAAAGSTALALEACSKDAGPFKQTEALDPNDAGPTNAYGDPCAPGALNLEGCACNAGTPPRDCFDSDAVLAGVGVCNLGKQECADATWSRCVGAGHPLGHLCDGQDNLCNHHPNDGCSPCELGETGACPDAGGGGGAGGAGGTGSGGDSPGNPCETGTVELIQDGSHGCQPTDSSKSVLYCDDSKQWQCFPADDCSPSACKACLESSCASELQAGSGCGKEFDEAVAWLEACGPDRTQYYLDRASKCNAVDMLNGCKENSCVMMGACSFW